VPVKDTLYHGFDVGCPLKVGIIGAGCAGLFTTLIFDHLNEKYGLQVEYEILESNSEERLRGRLFSYYFKNVQNPGKHDYYDAGAMRFPEINIMQR
jgi:protoporphyrinogen oxidase